MKDGFWMLLCAACLLLSARSVQARELTALDIFAQLPITLFENMCLFCNVHCQNLR